MSPRIFVSPRHKSCGDQRSRTGLQSGQAIVREGAQRPVMKVYTLIMRRVSEASLFFLGFPRKKKPRHNRSYEHRVPKIK